MWTKNTNQRLKKVFLRGGLFSVALFLLTACEEPRSESPAPQPAPEFYRAADLSAWPKVKQAGLPFFTADSVPGNFLDILQNQGLNMVRLRLWVDPENSHHSLAQVDSFAQVLKSRGLKVWLCLHLSDTWADPSHQKTPSRWQNLSYPDLADSLYHYVYRVNARIAPEVIQIGNEINPGFLHPQGHRFEKPEQFIQLLDTAIAAARAAYAPAEILLHYAGINQGALDFYQDVASLDYDIMGLSYYPIWHGKSLTALKNTFLALGQAHEQDLMVAETAYPFTLGWNDWTNNIVGMESQLVPGYPASPQGQKAFLNEVREIVENVPQGRGFAYWGAELIAWKGPQGEQASPFENQALFNFNQVALPVQEVFAP